MELTDMKYVYRGLQKQAHRNGAIRWRVRAQGNASLRIDIGCGPDHPEFHARYDHARMGIAPSSPPTPISELEAAKARKGSLGELVSAYLAHMEKQVGTGSVDIKTFNKRRNIFRRLDDHKDFKVSVPTHKIQDWIDEMAATPSQAQAFLTGLKLMFEWGRKRKMIAKNPVVDIEFKYKKGAGATPWTPENIKTFVAYHKPGTAPHVAAMVLMWTGCRVEDLLAIGRPCECIVEGDEAIRFQPQKKGSSLVTMPFLPPLKQAVRAPVVQGQVYVLNRFGRPFSSGDSMSSMFIKWCRQAGLMEHSAHGIRKGLAELLVEAGCTTYEVMAILGHSESKTTETYTRGAARWRLAKQAVERLNVARSWI